MEALTLSPEVLKWAAGQAGASLESLAQVVVRRAKDRARVLEGRLTAPQAEKLAKLAGVPFGLLFLAVPPSIERPSLPDLRQTPEAAPLGRDFRDVLDDALRKQQWFADHLREIGARPLPLVGRFAQAERPRAEVVADDMAATLGLTPTLRAAAGWRHWSS